MIKRIKSVVLTGGPCAGKSTGISNLFEFFGGLGYPIVSAPEAATELKINGVTINSVSNPNVFQDLIIKKILANEEFFARALKQMSFTAWKANKNTGILICDRGLRDGLAYVEKSEQYKKLLLQNGLDMQEVLSDRYNAVIHMRSAALGAEEYYTSANNEAREESVEEARELDIKTAESWLGHPNLNIISNDYNTFAEKINATVRIVAHLLGVPEPLTIERKWLVRGTGGIGVPVKVNIVQHYLTLEEERVRSWTHNGSTTYFHTKKSNVPGAQRVKIEHIITKDKYVELLQYADPRCAPIRKMRQYFIDNNQYFRLDRFLDDNDLRILEVQPTSLQEEIILPDFLSVTREVTDNLEYYNYNIAKRIKR